MMTDMKHMTIRNVPDDLHQALQKERRRRGQSLNQTVIELLRQRLAVGATARNGLARLGGGWSEDEFRAFEDATSVFERIDEEVWS